MAAEADGVGVGNSTAERLVRIEGKLDAILDRMGRMDACNSDHERRINSIEQVSASRNHQIEAIKNDVSRLEKKSESWSIINSIAAAVAAFLAALGFAK